MPQRQTKFSETWLSSVDSNGQRIGEWCRKGQNEYQAYCQFCDVQVKCDNAGKTQLLQHSKLLSSQPLLLEKQMLNLNVVCQ